MIRLADPALGDEEVALVEQVLRSGMLIQGPMVARFEQMVAERTTRKHAIAVNNGTSALELALRVLGVGPGDEVIVPALTWPSPAHAAAFIGADVVLVDVDAREWNAIPDAYARAKSPRTKAAIVIDQFGAPARIDEISHVLGGVPIIEDAACAIGSMRPRGIPCGAGAALSTFSFHPRKIVATGEGGMIVTDNDAYAARLRTLRNHGISGPGVFEEPGPNERMSEIAAALGVVQMQKLDAIIARRTDLALRIKRALPQLIFQAFPDGSRPNYQTLGAILPAAFNAAKRDEFIARAKQEGVELGILSHALHRIGSMRSAAERAVASKQRFTATEQLVDRGIALPLHTRLTDDDVTRMIDVLNKLTISFGVQ